MLFSVVPTSLYNTIDASAETTGFHVDGTTIRDGNGNAFVMRGVNIPYVWYTNHASSAIKAAARLGANAVRVVVSDGQAGYYAGKTSADSLRNIINTCKNNKVVCVLEVHDATGSDDSSSLTAATNYWIEMKSVLQGNEDYVIVNIANEWYGSWNNASAWAEGYKTAIESLRNAGIKNMLMVDSAGYGQWTNSIFQKGTEVFNADTLSNTVFSIHMYNTAGGNASTVKNNINNALALGVPLVIGEFGADHAGSDVDEATIMSYCTTKNVGYLGWSWMGNEGNLASLDISYDWDGTSLTTWGNTLFNSTYGIKNTSKLCTIFGGNVDESSSTGSTGTEEVIWEGTAEFAKWSSPNYDMEVDGIKNAEEGGYIKIDCQATGSGAQVQLATMQNEEDWTPLEDEFGNAQFTVVNDQIFFRLNATQAALLRTADDLHFKGNKVTVTKLTYLSPDYYNGKTVDIWEGDVEITGWTQDVDINTANIPMAEEDGLITFECEIIEGLLEEPDVPQLQISGNDGEWEWFDLHDPATDEAYIVSGNKLVITLTADDARALATASKLYVKGNGVRITKITYSDPNAPINPSSSSTSTPDSSS
ncbi:MAG: cellulase family glycosylhydrolase, partial [Ruminococcus sp.]|nr:cellulase family glycosylhydrolase [Ruminococcus sp.]